MQFGFPQSLVYPGLVIFICLESMTNSLITQLIWRKRRNEQMAKFGTTCKNDTQENCQQIKLIMKNKNRMCGKAS